VVLTKNEEKNIAGCLESVKWADEIVIDDDCSADRTVDIVKRYTDKVIVNASGGNLAKQRNLGIDNSSCEWILQMDADERAPVDFRMKVSELLASGSDLSAFRFRRLNNFCGKFMKFGGESLHKPLRLFRRGKARFLPSGNRIHEEIEVEGKVGELDTYLEHYNFPDIAHYIATQDFYSGIEAEQLSEKEPPIPAKQLKKELTSGLVKLFFKIYIKRQGFKDGFHGLIFAVLSAWRRFLIYAKYWEMNQSFYNKETK
jgi:glycosyltransferase involved in cell wall biosynthesis